MTNPNLPPNQRPNQSKTDPENPVANFAQVVRSTLDLVSNVLGNVDKLVSGVARDSVSVARETEALYGVAAERMEGVRDAIRATPRFTRIVAVGVRIIASYKLHGRIAPALSAEAAEDRLEELHYTNAARLYDLCVDLRGGVLKLGQLLSARMDILPHPYIEELSELQDRVPPIDSQSIIERIEDELGHPIGELFAEFDEEPIAAASLAQVHRAVLPDGQEVAVKVLVPGIEELIEIDLTALRVLSSVLGDLMPRMDMATILDEVARSLRTELDFEAESRSIAEFGANFAGDDDVIAPRVHEVYSSRRVLTMDLIEGERITDFLDGCRERGEDGEAELARVFEILLRCFCSQILEDGLFHADPHPGNFLVAPGPKLVVLDFGNVKRFPPERRIAYAHLAAAILSGDSEKIASSLGEMGFRTEGDDSESLIEFANMMMESFREDMSDLSSIDPKAQLEKALEAARNNPIVKVPEDFVMLGRVFATLGGLVLHYKPNIHLFTILAPHLTRIGDTLPPLNSL